MAVHGHTLVWHNQLPSWFVNGSFSRDEAIQLLHDHISTVVGHYKGRIAYWDVVNEAVADDGSGLRDTPWRHVYRRRLHRPRLPVRPRSRPRRGAVLQRLRRGRHGRESRTRSTTWSRTCSTGASRSAASGCQAHSIVGTLNFNAIGSNIQRLGDLGLQVQITEFDDRYDGEADADMLRRQAADYHELLQTCLDQPACTAFVTWGVYDKTTWLRGEQPRLLQQPDRRAAHVRR